MSYYNTQSSSGVKKVYIVSFGEPERMIVLRKGASFTFQEIQNRKDLFGGHTIDSNYIDFKGTCLVIMECIVPSWGSTYISVSDVKAARVIYASNHRVDILAKFLESTEKYINKYINESTVDAASFLNEARQWEEGDSVPILPKTKISDYDLVKIKNYKASDAKSVLEVQKIFDKKSVEDFMKALVLECHSIALRQDKERKECHEQNTDNNDCTKT